MFVANFVVQLDNFWTDGRYFNKLYYINVCVKVCLILVFSFCRLNICCLTLSLAQTQNLKLISFFCRSPVSGNRTSNSVFYNKVGRQSFLKPEKWLGRHERKSLLTKERKSSYQGPHHVVRKMVLVFSRTEAGEQQIGWVLGKYQATMGAVGKHVICQTSMPESTVQLPNILDTILPR